MVQEPTQPAADGDGFDSPRYVGPFRLLERIGAGGMGVVHLAERRQPVEQRVALKVIRTDRLDRTYRARFAMEQEALARMDHPNIARLLDAGVEGGQSWFAMEYVPGQPLDDYCREHRLSLEQRLRLFVQVCEGVQHAHIKGILHRDLKPGNILVREVDGRPIAKIIDFGLAQPVDPLQIRATLHEAVKQVVGTIAYMSPEQAERTEGDLDTRTDVYSLGAVLYELLTGEVPLDVDDVKRRGLAWFGTFLREHEPPRPSTRLSSLGERLSTTAAERGTTPQRLRSAVRGDLDWVTMKALARDRQQRYPTVRDLGREIERVLAHRPVEAGPPSAWYVARKWVRRHAVGVGVGAVVFFAAVMVAAVSERLAHQARAAELRRDLVARGLLAVEHLRRAEQDLWPADGDRVPALRAWLDDVRGILGVAPDLLAYERELAGSPQDDAMASQLEVVRRGAAAMADLPAMQQRVTARLERARTLRRRTVDALDAEWSAAATAVARDPRFAGFELPRLEGLVPLGTNPRTAQQEFYLLDSGIDGTVPVRRADGEFEVTAATGMVFVLVPGGRFTVPGALLGKGAADRVAATGPFLLSRYEMTQAQWARMMGEGLRDPIALSQHNVANVPDGLQRTNGGPGEPDRHETTDDWSPVTWVHPVQQVAWLRAEAGLRRWGLELPTSAQWLRAAAGHVRETVDFEWLKPDRGRWVNFFDEARRRARDRLSIEPRPPSAEWDGFVYTAPVGALAPNPFGFHELFGNVAELCRDAYLDEEVATIHDADRARAGPRGTGRVVHHGGRFTVSWLDYPAQATQIPIGNIDLAIGLRPVFRMHPGQ